MGCLDNNITGATTEKCFDEIQDILLSNSKRSHRGVRLIDELMVDIMGGLIPGVLFNISLLICILLPIIISKHFNPQDINNHVVENSSYSAFSGWFWFAAFLAFLIVSYIAGHIFFRSEINKADREDIKKRMDRNCKSVISSLSGSEHIDETILEMLQNELNPFIINDKTIDEIIPDNNEEANNLRSLLKFLSFSANAFINNPETTSNDLVNVKDKELLILTILFPHIFNDSSGRANPNPWAVPESKNSMNYLSDEEQKIYTDFKKKAKTIIRKCTLKNQFRKTLKSPKRLKELRNPKKVFVTIKSIILSKGDNENIHNLACLLISLLQNDSGCSHCLKRYEKHCYFPYLSFYKFLIKRNELNLIQHVDWSPAGARTKNKINRMKIEVQLEYPDAYAILNKNESHIRMASSSWYVSSFIYKMALVVCGIILFVKSCQSLNCSGNINDIFNYIISSVQNKNINYIINKFLNIILPALPPAVLAYLLIMMRKRVIHFIHYQRLREIFFTLYIFHKSEKRKNEAEDKELSLYKTLESGISKAFCDWVDRFYQRNDDMHWRFVE